MVSNDKGQNTTIVSVSVLGVSNAPFIIFKAAKGRTEWREAAPSGYYLRKSESGYINTDLFHESVEKFVEFLKEKKILVGQDRALLLLNVHRSHLFNLKFLEYIYKGKQGGGMQLPSSLHPPHATTRWYTIWKLQNRISKEPPQDQQVPIWSEDVKGYILQSICSSIFKCHDPRNNKEGLKEYWTHASW